MLAITSYIKGLGRVARQKKLWFFFYGALLLFGLLIILPIHGMIIEHLGFPLDIGRNLGEFDYTQVADLLNNHGEAIGVIFYQAKWILFFYVLVTVLLTSGVVCFFYFKKSQFSFSSFIEAAQKYFWKFLRLTIYFLTFQLSWLVLMLTIYKFYLGSFSPFEIENDSRLVSGFWLITPIYLIGAFLIQIVSDVCKYSIVGHSGKIIFSNIIFGFKTALKNIFPLLLFYIFHAVLFLFLAKIYLLIKSIFSLESSFGFWALILLGQLYILIKVALRLAKLAGLELLFREKLSEGVGHSSISIEE